MRDMRVVWPQCGTMLAEAVLTALASQAARSGTHFSQDLRRLLGVMALKRMPSGSA